MLRCKECERLDTAKISFDDMIQLVAVALVPGEKEVKLIEEMGGKPPVVRFTNLELVSTKNVSDLELDLSSEMVCGVCGHKGTVGNGDFIVVNKCHCGREEDNIFICRRYSTILCPACVVPFECEDCRFRECLYNPRYEGDEKPPVPTPRRRNRLDFHRTPPLQWED